MKAKGGASFRQTIRAVLLGFARRFGATIKDETGRVVGRALIIPFRGKIHVIGLERPVRPVWARQNRLSYWKQEISFTVPPPVNFPHETSKRGADPTAAD